MFDVFAHVFSYFRAVFIAVHVPTYGQHIHNISQAIRLAFAPYFFLSSRLSLSTMCNLLIELSLTHPDMYSHWYMVSSLSRIINLNFDMWYMWPMMPDLRVCTWPPCHLLPFACLVHHAMLLSTRHQLQVKRQNVLTMVMIMTTSGWPLPLHHNPCMHDDNDK